MEATDRSPLLGRRSRSPSPSQANFGPERASLWAKSNSTIIAMISVIFFFTCWANGFTIIPFLRLLEDRLCHEYYGDSVSPFEPIDESRCKEDWIQSQLAFIPSISTAVGAVVTFLSAFPWGAAADRIGRKPVLTLALTGMALEAFWNIAVLWFHQYLPLKLVWLSGLFNMIGGGNAIAVGMILSIVTDATTEEDRAVAFLRLHVAAMAGTLLSPTICAVLMERTSAWVCIVIGAFLIMFGGVAIYAVPEPLKKSRRPAPDAPPADFVDVAEDTKTLHRLQRLVSIPLSSSLLIFLLIVLLSMPASLCTSTMMSQYVSRRYEINLSSTGYIQSTYGVGHIIQAFVILPVVSTLLTASTTPAFLRAQSDKKRDFVLLQGSFVFLFLGLLAVGGATNLVAFMFGLIVMVLGSGFTSLLKSLMSLYVDSHHRSRLFSLIGMAEVLARVYGDPALAALLTAGLHHGGGWIGLPYYGVALFVAVCIGLLSLIKLPSKDDRDVSNDSDTE